MVYWVDGSGEHLEEGECNGVYVPYEGGGVGVFGWGSADNAIPTLCRDNCREAVFAFRVLERPRCYWCPGRAPLFSSQTLLFSSL